MKNDGGQAGLSGGGGSSWRAAVTGNVLMIGLVSLFTDFSSEMIYPLLPVFLTGLAPGWAPLAVGLMEGIAETTASLLKIFSGRLSDALGKRKALVIVGYGLSSVCRPLMGAAAAAWQAVLLRFGDRVGKGIRTSPRDALIGDSVGPDHRGLAFGFHRAMDHLGAVLGPIAAAFILFAFLGYAIWRGQETTTPEEMRALRWLFAIALVPSLAAMATLLFKVREIAPKKEGESGDSIGRSVSRPVRSVKTSTGRAAREPEKDPAGQVRPGHTPDRTPGVPSPDLPAISRWNLPRRFYLFVGVVTLFALGNSSDLFLLLYAKTRFNLGVLQILALWVGLHLSKMAFSVPGGHLSDRLGRRPVIIAGWVVYALVYLGMAEIGQVWQFWTLFLLYGLYYGLTEGAEKALVADFVPSDRLGSAFGIYHGAVGLAALPASLLFGVFWSVIGPRVAFGIGAALAGAAAVLLVVLLSATPRRRAAD